MKINLLTKIVFLICVLMLGCMSDFSFGSDTSDYRNFEYSIELLVLNSTTLNPIEGAKCYKSNTPRSKYYVTDSNGKALVVQFYRSESQLQKIGIEMTITKFQMITEIIHIGLYPTPNDSSYTVYLSSDNVLLN